MQKMKQNAAREARVKLNQMVNKDVKIDYLTGSREMRQHKETHSEEMDWTNILRKSVMNQKKTTKMRTYLTHLGTHGAAFLPDTSANSFKSSPGSKDAKSPGQKGGKKSSKTDTVKQQIVAATDDVIYYLIKLRRFPFVCSTKSTDKMSIKVSKYFYVDEEGNTFTDTE